MKQFTKEMKMVIQGDVCLTRVDSLPDSLSVVHPTNGQHIVTHSETGHNHCFDDGDVVLLDDPTDDLVGYIQVNSPAELKHHRSFDTHETIQFDTGIYRINRQREYTPEGFRQVLD